MINSRYNINYRNQHRQQGFDKQSTVLFSDTQKHQFIAQSTK